MSDFFFDLWLALRLLKDRNSWSLGATGILALCGLVLGVGSLIVSMAVMSGYVSTLKNNVADVTGHVQVLQMGFSSAKNEEEILKFESSIKKYPEISSWMPFLFVEGVLAQNGKISGIYMQGVDAEKVKKVLGLENRIKAGQFKISNDEVAEVLIGKTLAQQFSLKSGDEFNVVIPQYSEESSRFRRQLARLRVSGILDLGKVEYDERMIIADLRVVQKLSAVGKKSSGYLIKTKDIDQAPLLAKNLLKELGLEYRVRDWRDINENLFDAVNIEKVVVFFVIFIIVLASAFNVSISIYVNVVKKFADIAVLKSFGLSSSRLRRVFAWQGFLIGGIGSAAGVLLGFLFCWGFTILETNFGLLPASIYRIDRIDVQIKFWDIFVVVFASMVVCFFAALAPAKKGSELTIIEGLRYD